MRKFIFFMLFLLSCSAFSQKYATNRVFVLHINGINTTELDTRDNLRRLREITGEGDLVTWNYLYNETHGVLTHDIFDVLRQKRQEGKELTIDDFVMVYMKNNNLHYEFDSNEYNELKQTIKEKYLKDQNFVGANFNDIVDQFHKKIISPASDIVKILKSYNNNVSFLLVSHSQGNLYANQLYDYLVNVEKIPKYNIDLFGIASPSSNIRGQSYIDEYREDFGDDFKRYVTSDNDHVINAVRLFSHFIPNTNQPMPANGHIENCGGDILCHNLIDAYLNDDEDSRYEISAILSDFITILGNLHAVHR